VPLGFFRTVWIEVSMAIIGEVIRMAESDFFSKSDLFQTV
jgi:hypothetical protein